MTTPKVCLTGGDGIGWALDEDVRLTRRALEGRVELTAVEPCEPGQGIGGRLLVIWDGSPIHRCGLVKEFLAAGGAGYVHLEQFPPYAPDLNPDEQVWHHLKRVEMKNMCCLNLHQLSTELQLAINRLRKKPSLIQSFFAGAGLDL